MTGIGRCFCVQILQISESDQSWFLSYTNSLAFVSPRFIVFGYFRIMSEVSKITSRSTQCFIDGKENKNGNLA